MNSDAAAVQLLDQAMARLDALRLQLLGMAAPVVAVTESTIVRETVIERCAPHCVVCFPPRAPSVPSALQSLAVRPEAIDRATAVEALKELEPPRDGLRRPRRLR